MNWRNEVDAVSHRLWWVEDCQPGMSPLCHAGTDTAGCTVRTIFLLALVASKLAQQWCNVVVLCAEKIIRAAAILQYYKSAANTTYQTNYKYIPCPKNNKCNIESKHENSYRVYWIGNNRCHTLVASYQSRQSSPSCPNERGSCDTQGHYNVNKWLWWFHDITKLYACMYSSVLWCCWSGNMKNSQPVKALLQ